MGRVRHPILLNLDELDALAGMPPLCVVLYIALRARMDYESGLVGSVRGAGVSWQALREELYVEPGPGQVQSGSPTKAAVRRAAARLGRAGLVEMRTRGKLLIFFCVLATLGYSAKNKPGTKSAHHPGTQHDIGDDGEKHKGNKVVTLMRRPQGVTQPGTPENQQPGTHQSIRDINISSSSAISAYTRVDPLRAALLDLGFNAGQLNPASVQAMLVDWRDAEVTPADVRVVYQAVKRRAPRKGFGPAYLLGPMRDHKRGLLLSDERPDWARVPVVDEELWPWATRNGYCGPGTMTNLQYRRRLLLEVERRMSREEFA